MEISTKKVKKKSSDGDDDNINPAFVKLAEEKASDINGDLLDVSDTLFSLFLDIFERYDTCPLDCLGFQCRGCWRGVIIVLAYENKKFHNFVKRSNGRSPDVIIRGVEVYAGR